MTRSPSFDLVVDGGQLFAFSADLPASSREDLIVMSLYAQLAADHASARDSQPQQWHKQYLRTLKFLGMSLPIASEHTFTVETSQKHSLLQWLARDAAEQPVNKLWQQALTHPAALPACGAATQLFEKRSWVQTQTPAGTCVTLRIAEAAADGGVSLWFVLLQTRERVETGLLSHAFDGAQICEPIKIAHYAGALEARFVDHREQISASIERYRQDWVLDVPKEQAQ